MRNLISAYKIKSGGEALNRWDNQREEASRQKRLAEVRAAVHSNRPPRPRAPGQVVSRATSAGSRIPQSRARSASSQRSYGTSATGRTATDSVSKVDHIGPAKSAAKGAASRLDPRFLLSPAGRERDAQQYVSSSSEVAAMKAEMQDWYFARSSASTAQEEFIEEQVEDLFEANGFEQVVKPSAVAEVRRRSPYSVDLNPRPRARSAGRPQSVPHCLAAGQPGVQQPGARPSLGSREGPETFIDRQPCRDDAHAESPSGKANAEAPRAQPDRNSPVQAKVDKPSGSPDLRSAEAINDWLVQANQRMASAFSGKPTEDNHVTVAEMKPAEGSRPDSLSNTGTTVYAPTVLLAASTGPCSPVAQSQGAAGAVSAPNSPQQADLLDLSRTEEVAATADPSGVASQNGLGSPGRDSEASMTHSDGEGSLELKRSSPAAARHATSGVLNSESEHFSDEDFDEDEEDVAFDASALDGDVVSDHGSSGGASLSFDAPAPVTSTARPGSAAGTRPESATSLRPGSATSLRPGSATSLRPGSAAGTRPESASLRPGSATAIRPGSATAIRPGSAARAPQLPPASASRKQGEGLGTTNASISYDEDFEAADVEEDETLGASFGGA